MSNSIKLFIILIIAGVFLSAGLFSLAQEEISAEVIEAINLDEDIKSEDLGIGEPRLLPDSPFYFFKEIGRGIQSFFTFNPVAKAELKLKFANEKIIEAKKLVEKKKKPEIIKKGLENYQEEIENIKIASEKIKVKAEESPEVSSFLDKFTKHQTLHHRILQKLETQVPPQAFEKIKEAREEHLERFGEVMIKLEDRTEKITEKLEKNMEEIKGSEFKNFKNLEVLKELEEKIPEEAKEAIRQARENSLIRLKTNIEKMSEEKLEKFKAYTEKISGEKEKQMEILEDLRTRLQNPETQEKLKEARDKIRGIIKQREIESQEKKPSVCAEIWDPVCGKNGKTYSNECFAKVAGVEVAYKGVCKEEIEP